METSLRDALHRDAKGIVETLLNDRTLIPELEPRNECETVYSNRTRTIQTLFGPIQLSRNYHHHNKAGNGRFPLDEQLDLTGAYTPAVARLICRASALGGSYQQAGEDLQIYAGLSLQSRRFHRVVEKLAPELSEGLDLLPPLAGSSSKTESIPVMYVSCDGTGIPARSEELVGRKGKQPDGSARTREAKLGCIFTQSTLAENGDPLRDPDSTSYVGTLQGCREIGTLLRHEAYRRGYAHAQKTVYLGDGALWIWENARINFPGAIEILDFYHACEHAGELARAIWGADSKKSEEYQSRWCSKMKRSSAAPVIKSARRLLIKQGGQMDLPQRKAIETEIKYFENNSARMRYGHFRAEGYFIGSGVIEAGCKTVVGKEDETVWNVLGRNRGRGYIESAMSTAWPAF